MLRSISFLLESENQKLIWYFEENKDVKKVHPPKPLVKATIVVTKDAVCYDC